MMRARRGARPLLGMLIVALAATACTEAPVVDGGADSAEVAVTPQSSPPNSAAGDLRLDLERHFALHSHLSTELVRVGGRRQSAAEDAVQANLGELSRIAADAYDARVGEQLRQAFGGISDRLATYRRVARRSRTGRAVQQARQRLRRSAAEAGSFMSRTTGGGLEQRGTTALLRAALLDLADHTDAYVRRDFEAAYVAERDAFAAMISVGRTFAAGISEQNADEFPGPRRSGAIELRSALAQLLGEHSGLAVTMMRRGSVGADDFEAAAAALNGNTEDLLAALETVYPDVTRSLGSAWRDLISHLADYTVAAARDRRPARRDARSSLQRLGEEIAASLGEASEGEIDESALDEQMSDHVDALLEQIDAYLAGDATAAEGHRSTAFERAAQVSDTIAEGIAQHRPDEFPAQ